ncbi:M23 family metallopeptidase [Chroococcus sp. FPU101]|uniref:peptidoglycan DD-metalloendopeptidase family protein n=1 Tax=Chroococcus sp. FPU101 TaxID=1974212 RepID=UPI001AAB5199|nr:M23 family metallopeptidase [Chroococcus sp. FPU101]GFE67617.1 putative peptidase [Chroococcus sp. FPU101]
MMKGLKVLRRGCLVGLFLMSIAQSGLAQSGFPQPQIKPNRPLCPSPVLSRLKRHKIIAGETVQSIAQQYNLLPETLLRLNPILKQKTVPVGKEILIPPFNGIRIQAPKGATWRDIGEAYGISSDVLFELNGCAKTPNIVFIPGTNWSSSSKKDYLGLSGYPLPFVAPIGLKYGWQPSPIGQQRLFHSGVDLLADVGTPVLAAEGGEVVFVGQEGAYGILIVINHPSDRQTRYAHLSKVNVKMGQFVQTGDVIGAVGTTGEPDISSPHLHFEVRTKLSVGWVAQDAEIHFLSQPKSK